MISNPVVEEGAWTKVDALPDAALCALHDLKEESMPSVLHYCQSYELGDISFHKVRSDTKIKDSLVCNMPLFRTRMPLDHGHWAHTPLGHRQEKAARRKAFMLCQIYTAINSALTDYKAKTCGLQANLTNLLEWVDVKQDQVYHTVQAERQAKRWAEKQHAAPCHDTPGWRNTDVSDLSCLQYYELGFCQYGRVPRDKRWTLGAKYNFPEQNCCACGKGPGSLT